MKDLFILHQVCYEGFVYSPSDPYEYITFVPALLEGSVQFGTVQMDYKCLANVTNTICIHAGLNCKPQRFVEINCGNRTKCTIGNSDSLRHFNQTVCDQERDV
jgi:hypothetical protein